MTRSELIQKLAEKNPHLYLRDVETIVDTTFDEITEALIRGGLRRPFPSSGDLP